MPITISNVDQEKDVDSVKVDSRGDWLDRRNQDRHASLSIGFGIDGAK